MTINPVLGKTTQQIQEKWGAGVVQDSPMVEKFSADLPATESY